ncbi:hypothetical protein Pla163_31240 [Planctomycetes bacterium Pla163]|uniref:Uncharacterized protein n=1 Tax=Rohdeia mirabilis TaxID=2528008 RepID=A0A518D3D2_9BACT|nr:hypothetical protein Pla163_31240 [Planctomycetes bacterium Pla163]
MPKSTSNDPRRAWVLAAVGILLVAVAWVLWSEIGGDDEPLGRTDAEVSPEAPAGPRTDVELADGPAAVEGTADDRHVAAEAPISERAVLESEAAVEARPVVPVLDVPAPSAFVDTPVEHVPVGDAVVLDLEVRAPAQIGSPRLPAWLDLERGGAEPDVRRVLGDIEGDRWKFVVAGLRTGRHRWTVRTGIHAPIAGGARLEVGRNEVRYELADFDASTVVVAAEFPWGAEDDPEDASGGSSDESVHPNGLPVAEAQPANLPSWIGNDPHAPTTFGPSVPWVVFDGATPDDTVLVPLDAWFDAWTGVVPQQGPLESRTHVVGAPLGGVRPRLLGGLPLTHEATVEQEIGGATALVRDVEDATESATVEVKVRWPEKTATGAAANASASTDDASPTAVTALLYGAVPEDLGALDVSNGPTMWRGIEVPLPLVSELLPSGWLTLDPRTTPRGARVAFVSPGMQPIFHDLDALLETQQVLLEFEPGSGGVLVGAYQNHRFPEAHWAPAFGFDVAWGTDAGTRQLVADGSTDAMPFDLRRTGPMGFVEFADADVRAFDAASLVLGRPDSNAERLARAMHSNLLMELRDAAPGVVELFVQD